MLFEKNLNGCFIVPSQKMCRLAIAMNDMKSIQRWILQGYLDYNAVLSMACEVDNVEMAKYAVKNNATVTNNELHKAYHLKNVGVSRYLSLLQVEYDEICACHLWYKKIELRDLFIILLKPNSKFPLPESLTRILYYTLTSDD